MADDTQRSEVLEVTQASALIHCHYVICKQQNTDYVVFELSDTP